MPLKKISTTAFEEEDFYILSDLSDEQIFKSLMPVIDTERNGGENYNNDILVSKLKKDYPSSTIEEIFITKIVL